MEFNIKVHENGQITLKRNNEVIIISKYMSRILDIVDDMYKNNGESKLLKPNSSELGRLFDL